MPDLSLVAAALAQAAAEHDGHLCQFQVRGGLACCEHGWAYEFGRVEAGTEVAA